jgi:hypothetical protein
MAPFFYRFFPPFLVAASHTFTWAIRISAAQQRQRDNMVRIVVAVAMEEKRTNLHRGGGAASLLPQFFAKPLFPMSDGFLARRVYSISTKVEHSSF